MMTKTDFFALLNDSNNKIGVTAHISVYGLNGGKTALIIKQHGAPNTSLSTHKDSANTIQAAFTKYNTWLNEWFTAQAEEAQRRIDLLDEIAADKAEGDELAAAIQQDIDVAMAHTEALEVNAIVDVAVQRAACYSDLDAATSNAINHAINTIRNGLMDLNRYNANFIVKMMISVRRLSKLARQQAAANYRDMMERCQRGEGTEIPF